MQLVRNWSLWGFAYVPELLVTIALQADPSFSCRCSTASHWHRQQNATIVMQRLAQRPDTATLVAVYVPSQTNNLLGFDSVRACRRVQRQH
jgi:hypothetical protein